MFSSWFWRISFKGQINQKIDIFSFVAFPSPNTEKNHPKWDLGKDFSSQAFTKDKRSKSEHFRKLHENISETAAWLTGDYVTSMLVFQGGKRSAQPSAHPLSPAFVCLVLWFWLRLNEIHEVRTFAPCKGFFCFCCCFFVTWKLLWIQNNQCYNKNRSSVSLRRNKTFWTFPKRFVFFW